ncbi:MAG: ABC transporter permease [Candidatus Roizmanbacteria bacterium]|nr:ABC transporter permease [Candidatus Roizmanbacteria bacterium]
MNYFIFIIQSSIKDLLRSKMRTFLTSLGILIGVASVVLLLSFGLGLKAYIKGQFDSLGTNLVFVIPGQVFGNSGGFQGMRSAVQFDERDLVSLRKLRDALFIIPVFTKSIKVEGNAKTDYATLYSTTDEIFPARNLEIEYGRLFDKPEVDKRTRVIVVGPKVIEKMYDNPILALNKSLRIEGQTFKIIGILKSKGGGGFGGPDFDKFIYMPLKTGYAFNTDKKIATFLIKAPDNKPFILFKAEVKSQMMKRYKEDEITVADSAEFITTISSIFSILNSVLVAIGAVSLIVGGIGIMNIMYVSVTERIREIGIRRALGATEKDILYQFLSESVILSLLGGIMGLGISFIVVTFVQQFFPAYVDLMSSIIALGTSSFIGIFFGVFPARKAAALSPIDAIRYE